MINSTKHPCYCREYQCHIKYCTNCLWRMMLRWSVVLCVLSASVYYFLGHRLPRGFLVESRWWDIIGIVVYTCGIVWLVTRPSESLPDFDTQWEETICIGVLLGIIGGIVALFWKGLVLGILITLGIAVGIAILSLLLFALKFLAEVFWCVTGDWLKGK